MKALIRVVLVFFFIVYLLNIFIDIMRKDVITFESGPSSTKEQCQDQFFIDSLTFNIRHQRNWRSVLTFEEFCTTYDSYEQISRVSQKGRSSFTPFGYAYEDYWGSLYKHLAKLDQEKVKFLSDSLYNAGQAKGLDAKELLSMVVSFVQDIPYSLIKVGQCENEGKPCKEDVKYGILSPYEFIHTLEGDCDTRAVLLFCIFSNMGFDPMIVISENYLHAMLALNFPVAGDYLTYKRKKYYFWETTAKGWSLGMLPPSYKNVSYWKVALVNP